MVRPEAEVYGSTASLLFAGAGYRQDRNQAVRRQTLKCLLCGDPHEDIECEKYPSVDRPGSDEDLQLPMTLSTGTTDSFMQPKLRWRTDLSREGQS